MSQPSGSPDEVIDIEPGRDEKDKNDENGRKNQSVITGGQKKMTGFIDEGMQVLNVHTVMNLNLKGDLAKTAAWAFKDGEVDELGLRLMRGHCVFSRDWKSDLWLHLKNKQIFLSAFLVAPTHPFTRSERRKALIVSCVLAWGLEAWFCVLWTSCEEHPDLNFVENFIRHMLLKILVSAVANGLYDAILEFGMTCACVQTGVPDWVRECCEAFSVFQLCAQLAGGVVLLYYAIAALLVSNGGATGTFWGYFGVSIRELIIGKFMGLFVVTMLVEILGYLFTRKAQMKPDRDEPKRLEIWNAPSPPKPPFCFCKEYEGDPPNMMWNSFIGEDKYYIHLPERAPTYDVSVNLWCWSYHEYANEPAKIPKWFLSDLTQPASKMEKWLRSDDNPRMVGQEHLWENPPETKKKISMVLSFKPKKTSSVTPGPVLETEHQDLTNMEEKGS